MTALATFPSTGPRIHRHDRYARLIDIIALVNATRFAVERGTRLTALITVVWKDCPRFRELGWQQADERLIRAMRRFLHNEGIELAYAYMRENTKGGRGPHTHFMVHLPNYRWRELADGLERFLTRELRFRDTARVRSPSVKITGDDYGTPGMITDRQNAGLISYLAKSLDPNEAIGQLRVAKLLGIQTSEHAMVREKRVGTSENIGPKARSARGWKDLGLDDLWELRRYLRKDPSRVSVTNVVEPSRLLRR